MTKLIAAFYHCFVNAPKYLQVFAKDTSIEIICYPFRAKCCFMFRFPFLFAAAGDCNGRILSCLMDATAYPCLLIQLDTFPFVH